MQTTDLTHYLARSHFKSASMEESDVQVQLFGIVALGCPCGCVKTLGEKG